MSAPAPSTTNANPWKGSESYQIEDAELFFGREAEAKRLIARILSSRVVLVHAQSGAGKTSLLNARVIPGLESSGWAAVRVLPQNHPTESLRVTTLHHTLPSPLSELSALTRARQLFDPGGDLPLGEYLKQYDRLQVSDPRRRDLLAPIDAPAVGALPSAGRIRPLFLRVLRGTLSVADYREHLNAVRQAGGARPVAGLDESARLSEWESALRDPDLEQAHESAISNLYGPDPDLRFLFENLFFSYGAFAPRFSLVVILDQFEELFTRFIDAGAGASERSGQPDWRMRWEFLGQLDRLLAERAMAAAVGSSSARQAAPLPLRIVISMRDEYVAQLDPVRRFVPELDSTAFHLSFLEKENARSAIVEPAGRFNVSIDETSFKNIAADLTREDRYIEPAQLQIVCQKVWSEYAEGSKTGSAIQVKEGRTKAILATFFSEFLDSIGPPGDTNRLEALEILEPLVTSSRTRNIVERQHLINAPYRDSVRRTNLVERMVQRMIVRVETRLGGRFVEITHEFLISPILEAIRTELNGNAEYGRFRWAVRTLERFEDVDLHDTRQALLDLGVFNALNKSRDQLVWTDFAIELMFRSALRSGAQRELLAEWALRFGQAGAATSLEEILSEERLHDPARAMLSLEELHAIWAARDEDRLKFEQVSFLLRNLMLRESPREQISHWMRRLIELCQEMP